MKKIMLKIFLFAALCTSLLAGCSESDPTSEAEAAEIPEFTKETEIIEGRKNIYLIVKNITSSYWQVIIDGVRDAGNELDCNIYSSGSTSEIQWELQSSLIDKAIAEGADAIIFAPNDSVMLSSKVSEVYCSGMPVVLVDTVVNTEDYTICYMTDNLYAGQNAAKEMLKRFEEFGISNDEEAYVAIQIGAISSQTISERLAGFCQYWTKYAPENWKILDEVK
ncbi:MAG: substrate-binding domain-containing protein, partial [Huintestinicola sp.]